MVKRHLSRLNAPKSWPIKRKGIKFIRKPSPGAHTLRQCISLSLVIQNMLKYAKTSKEIKKILHERKILVNGKVKRDSAFAVGIMDVLSIPTLKENYRVLYNTKGKFVLMKIEEKDANEILMKIINKTLIKKGKIQYNYSNGHNHLIEKDDYKTGDSILLSLKDKKITKHFELKKGAQIYLTGGKFIGNTAILEEIKEDKVTIKIKDEIFETAKRYLFVIGDVKIENE
ncbi:30S ribosomal protein S4e [archaeon]|jgi:small subunit ribosomal protein S4e|nr:30S ribosomal protein S4e [archaeon]MBT3730916.1 30S ribosomal protein S4e [archaeon]MBT4669845.1 30S ribosomal protein S4e [archaeon]MBT5029997.1 30S ribosomal protein S4e [archaeon]MBT5288098.1 30S ribosomal protein S4e [archaeon]